MLKGKMKKTGWVALLAILVSCAEETPKNSPDEDTEYLEQIEEKLDAVDSKRAILVESIIRSSPTISESSEIFAQISSDFSRDYLNDINNVQSYTTLKAQGINLGVYLADLGYIATFEQSQEVIFYMNSAQKLAEGIGVSDVFDESTVERMEMNINDKDSIIEIISDLYWKTDDFLKELNRENISALIICGGWVEGLQIGSRLIADGYNDNLIYEEMLNQEKNLKKILNLLGTFEGDENIDYFEEHFNEFNDLYEALPPSSDGITDEQKAHLTNLAKKIGEFRNELIAA